MSETVKIECGACGSTGLYKGFAEPAGTAVICNQCGGKGYKEAKPFTGRRRKEGIQRVMVDGGLWFMRTGSNPQTISIEEFERAVSNG